MQPSARLGSSSANAGALSNDKRSGRSSPMRYQLSLPAHASNVFGDFDRSVFVAFAALLVTVALGALWVGVEEAAFGAVERGTK